MSSLRVALKQSLQEAGSAGGKQKQKQSRSNRNKRDDGGVIKKKKRKGLKGTRPGSSSSKGSRQHQRGGGGGSPRGRHNNNNNNSDDEDDYEEQKDHDAYGDTSSDENEFSAGGEEEEDDDDEEEESDTQSHNDEDDNPHNTHNENSHHHHHHHRGSQNSNNKEEGEETSHKTSSTRPQHAHDSDEEGGGEDSDHERRQHHHHRKLQKKLKHSAANKIQSQWKKKKEESNTYETEEGDIKKQAPADSQATPATITEAQSRDNHQTKTKQVGEEHQEDTALRKKKKKNKGDNNRGSGKGKTAKTVPPPSAEILEWNRDLPMKKARRNVTQGLRVKVRFATKVKRDGKIVRKKKWFGGRVSAVSKEGSKIRIKYDDGTAEISKFPDKDVVVDDALNGEHQADASKFQPPPPPEDSVAEQEIVQNDNSQQPQPPKRHETARGSVVEEERIPSPVSRLAATHAHEVKQSTSQSPVLQEEQQQRKQQSPPTLAPLVSAESQAAVVSHVDTAKPAPSEEVKPTDVSSKSSHKGDTNEKQEIVPVANEKTTNLEAQDTLKGTEETEAAIPEDKVKQATERASPSSDEAPAKEVSVPEQEEPEEPSQLLPPKAATSRPSLTIRIPNIKEVERRTSETKPLTLSIKMSRPVPKDTSDEVSTVPDGRKGGSPAPHMVPAADVEQKSAGRSRKRRLDGDSGQGGSEEEAVAPPSKRIHIQRPAVVADDSVPVATATSPKQIPESHPSKAPTSRPTSRASNDAISAKKGRPSADRTTTNVVAAVDGTTDDVDEGPVNVDGRSSARRIPLFSDEGGDAPDKIKPKKRRSPAELGSGKPATIIQKPKERTETQRPLPTKVTAKLTLSLGSSDNNSAAIASDKDKVLVSSQNSAFEKKGPAKKSERVDEQLPQTNPETSISTESTKASAITIQRPPTPKEKVPQGAVTPVIRSGRKAAQQANERIVSAKPDGEKEKEPTTGGKKRKKKEKSDEDSESSNEDDNNWVQCDRCKKWRIIPNNIKISSLPERWYCHLNEYDPKRNSCDAPEQTARTPIVKKKGRSRKKMRQRAEALEEANSEDQKTHTRNNSSQSDVTKEKVRSRTPTPKEETKPKETLQTIVTPKPPRAFPNSSVVASAESAPLTQVENEPQKKSKSQKKTKRLPDAPLESIPESAPADAKVKRPRGGRSRKEIKESAKEQDQEVGNSSVHGSVHGSVSSMPTEQDADNVEWVQCEKCDKWRKLPPHISADELPDVWYCSMNTWNPGSSSCDAPEDKADGQQDIGVFGGSSHHGAGKLTYRNLIFGSGRKVNRPVSERTRAAESIFAAPSDDSESTYPTVMYANSSAFAPRGSRANIIEEESQGVSVFDLMQHSNLWAELRSSSQPFNQSSFESAGFGRPLLFETLPPNMKQDMKDMILRALEDKTLLGEEVLLECQCRKWENTPPSWGEVRSYCTKDIVITLLCELVTEGKVELVQAFGTDWTVKDWNPRYRLARDVRKENVPPPAPKSRCMKIAKPWKQKV